MDKALRDWALIGARIELTKLDEQRARLLEVFPELSADGTRPAAEVATPQHANGGKRPHWTQTPEGRKRMSRISRKSWRDGRG